MPLFVYAQTSSRSDDKYTYKNIGGEEGLIQNNKKVGLWKSYKNDTLYDVNYYYNDKIKFIFDKNDFILKEKKELLNETFKVSIPKYWKQIKGKGNLLFSVKKINEDLKFQQTFSFTKIKIDSAYNFVENIKVMSSYFSKQKKEFKLIQKRFIEPKIKNYKSAKIVFSFEEKDDLYGTILLICKMDDFLIVLTGTALLDNNEFIKNKCVSEEVFSTLRVNDQYIFDKLNVFY